jgi:hypothetical protein
MKIARAFGVWLIAVWGWAVPQERSSAAEIAGEIHAASPDQLVELVLGRGKPLWNYKGFRFRGPDGHVETEAVLLYQPFRSSPDYCRAYMTKIRSPGWICREGDCPADRTEAYEVFTKPRVAIAAANVKCDELDLESNYFSLETDILDFEVTTLLDQLRAVLRDWKLTPQGEGASCDLHVLSERRLLSIDTVQYAAQSEVSFVFRHPCTSGGRVEIHAPRDPRAVKPYDVSEILP